VPRDIARPEQVNGLCRRAASMKGVPRAKALLSMLPWLDEAALVGEYDRLHPVA
jgi:hypothetical protein